MHIEKNELSSGERWAEGIISELVANGTLADNPLERLRNLFKRNFPKNEAEVERSREVLAAASIPEDALDFSRADMPITESGLQWLKRWQVRSDVP